MKWIYDKFVEWILENLAGLFDVLSDALLSFFNLDLDMFNSFFSFFWTTGNSGMEMSLYDIFRYAGFALVALLVVLRLLQNLASSISDDYEDPIQLVFRVFLAVFLVAFAKDIVNLEFTVIQGIYDATGSTMAIAADTAEAAAGEDSIWSRLADTFTNYFTEYNYGGGNNIVISIMTILCLWMIFKEYFTLAVEVAERYVVVAVSFYMSPLVFSTVATKGTSKIFHSFIRMVFSELLLMVFNIVFVRGANIAIFNYISNGGQYASGRTLETVPPFIFCLLLLAFIKVGQRMDAYMKTIGLDTVQTGRFGDAIGSSFKEVTGMAKGVMGAPGKVVKGAKSIGSAAGKVGSTARGAAGKAASGIAGTAAAGEGANFAGKVAANAAQKSAQSQFAKGGFSNSSADSNESVRKAAETAMGADNMDKMGIDPSTIQGTKGGFSFKTMDGKQGEVSFNQKNGNGWTEIPKGGFNAADAAKAAGQTPQGSGIWVKGSSTLGTTLGAAAGAQAGQVQSLADTVGAGAAAGIAGSSAFGGAAKAAAKSALGNSMDVSGVKMDSAEGISASGFSGFTAVGTDKNGNAAEKSFSVSSIADGKGGFNIVGTAEDGTACSLGRVVSAESAAGIPGANVSTNEFGGQAAFIPAANAPAAMSGLDIEGSGCISVGGGRSMAVDDLCSAIGGDMEKANIPEGTAMVGFSSDGTNYTATFADPVSGTRELTGSMDSITSSGMPTFSDEQVDSSGARWGGMSDVFDVNGYTASCGSAPHSIEYDSKDNIWRVQNEDGTSVVLEQAAYYDGDLARANCISGGDLIDNVPLVLKKDKDTGGRKKNNPNPGDG